MLAFTLAGVSFSAEPAAPAPAAPAPAAAEKPKPPEVGDAVADFTLVGLDGKSVNFADDIKGKKAVTVLVFMTTACSACQAEIKALSDMMSKFGEKVGVYAISVDIRGADTVKPYSETYNYKVTYLLDPKFSLPRSFGFSYTPSVAMIDKSGKLILKKGGYNPGDEELLQEKVMEFAKK